MLPRDASLAAQVLAAVAAGPSGGSLPPEAAPGLARVLRAAFRSLEAPRGRRSRAGPGGEGEGATHVTCLEDGMRMRELTRHLRRAHGLTPDQYRNRWGLGEDHPMSCSEASRGRSAQARRTGLGRPGPDREARA